MNPSLELLENVLFSIVLNHYTLGSENVVNSDLKSNIISSTKGLVLPETHTFGAAQAE